MESLSIWIIFSICLSHQYDKKALNLNPKKLLHSKWTATKPTNKEKHFIVTKLVISDLETQVVEAVELEAVMTGRKQVLPWRDLQNTETWKQGWQV